jgi:predicted HTH domain antitoxin
MKTTSTLSDELFREASMVSDELFREPSTVSDELIRELLSAYPGISARFISNLMALGVHHHDRSPSEFGRELALNLYRSGKLRLKPFVQLAMKTLNEKDFELFLRNLFRKKRPKSDFHLDTVICYLDDIGKLANCNARQAAEHVTAYLKARGVSYKFSAAAYRQRVGRLRRKGVTLRVRV